MKKLESNIKGILILLVIITSLSAALANDNIVYHENKAKGFASAINASTCHVLGQAKGMPQEDLKIFIDRVGVYNTHPDVIYNLGYQKGALDTYSSLNARRLGSHNLAKLDAAIQLYKLFSCTSSQEI